MSSTGNTGSGFTGGSDKKGKGKSVHPVHTASSWRKTTTTESSNVAENPNQTSTSAVTTAATTTATAATNPAISTGSATAAAPIILPPRAPINNYRYPQACGKFQPYTAAYGRNQALRALYLATKDRPDAWVVDLVKPIFRDANSRRGVFLKSAREEGRDNEIYRWQDEDLDAVQLGTIANAPDEG